MSDESCGGQGRRTQPSLSRAEREIGLEPTEIPVLALSPVSATAAAVAGVREAGYVVWVTMPGSPTIGTDPAVGALDGPDSRTAQVTEVAAAAGAPGGVLIVQPVARSEGESVIRLLVTDDDLSAGVRRIWLLLGGIGLVLFLLSIFVADRLARAMTRPITRLAETAELLGRGDVGARVQPAGPPEVASVGAALNRLGGRIGDLLISERESVADLRHRLRTPVTALRLDVEGLTDDDARGRLAADVDALDRAVDEVIRSARRATDPDAATCDAAAVVRDRMVFWSVLATHQHRPVTTSVTASPVPVRAAASDLAAALDSLVGNVFAHTGDDVAFEVRCSSASGGGAVVAVLDAGPGFAPGAGRRGESGGGSTGLGLDIARQIAESSGGSLTVARSADGRTAVTIELGPMVTGG
ncbi:signal transduction histidine kinase [Nakamurella sp. UYEF19]|uniref:sensor histidine kinase n=1 Tax=Nakamurella sp. UYEF19 TaxID=1756392 RepID=UPI0033986978